MVEKLITRSLFNKSSSSTNKPVHHSHPSKPGVRQHLIRPHWTQLFCIRCVGADHLWCSRPWKTTLTAGWTIHGLLKTTSLKWKTIYQTIILRFDVVVFLGRCIKNSRILGPNPPKFLSIFKHPPGLWCQWQGLMAGFCTWTSLCNISCILPSLVGLGKSQPVGRHCYWPQTLVVNTRRCHPV